MKVTAILPQKNEAAKNIYIDGEFSFSASIEDIFKFSIIEGMELNKDALAELISSCEYSKAYEYCLRLLSVRDYPVKEIRTKLKKRSFCESTIDSVINKLCEYNLINDSTYAEKYTNDCLKIKGYGINKIKNNLSVRGIGKETIACLEIDPDEQIKLCVEAAAKKERLLGECKNKREKLFRFLISKGFEYETVMKVLKNNAYSDDL